VYQVGQLLGMLVKGDARARIRTPDVRYLSCRGGGPTAGPPPARVRGRPNSLQDAGVKLIEIKTAA